MNWKELEKQSLDQTINPLAMASPFSLEEKQILPSLFISFGGPPDGPDGPDGRPAS